MRTAMAACCIRGGHDRTVLSATGVGVRCHRLRYACCLGRAGVCFSLPAGRGGVRADTVRFFKLIASESIYQN